MADEHSEPAMPDDPAAQGEAPAVQPLPSAPHAPDFREDQIHNAVAFLSHPKVRSSDEASKRGFLQRKGLTEAEIDEALRRVPQAPPPPVISAVPAVTGAAPPKPFGIGGGQGNQLVLQQPLGQVTALQPSSPAPEPPAPLRWTQVVLGASVAVAALYGVNRLMQPYISSWYQRWAAAVVRKGRAVDGKEEQETAQLVASAIKEQTLQLKESVDSMKAMLEGLEKSNAAAAAAAVAAAAATPPPPAGLSVSNLREELRGFASTLSEMGRPAPSAAQAPNAGALDDVKRDLAEVKALMLARPPAQISSPVRSASGAGVSSPKGYKSPSGLHVATGARQLNGCMSSSPDPYTPGPSPWPLPGNGTANGQDAPQSHEPQPATTAPEAGEAADGTAAPAEPPHPASYIDVLEMLERGETPPGIRTDINDKPPDPTQPITNPRLQPRPKPWERKPPDGEAPPSLFARPASLQDLPQNPSRPADDATSTASAPAAPSNSFPPASDAAGTSFPAASYAAVAAGRGGPTPPPSDGGSVGAAPGRADDGGWRPPAVPSPSVALRPKRAPSSIASSADGITA